MEDEIKVLFEKRTNLSGDLSSFGDRLAASGNEISELQAKLNAHVSKYDKIIFEIGGKQIDMKQIEKKAAKFGGTVYVVANERKIYDSEGNSINLF